MTDARFGLSTRLFLSQRLDQHHIQQIAAHGFKTIEAVAAPAHFDCRDAGAVARLGEWLSASDVTLHSVHAPAEASVASADESARARAVDDVIAALDVARLVPYQYLVLHLGTSAPANKPGENQPGAARKSLERIAGAAASLSIDVALEVIANPLSNPQALVQLIEDDLDEFDLGICLDFGHAHMLGDLAECIETVAGHVTTTHLHDNRGRSDDHLPPFGGSIAWDVAMMETQKIGYDGVLMFEVAAQGDAEATLKRCAEARERLARTFVTF